MSKKFKANTAFLPVPIFYASPLHAANDDKSLPTHPNQLSPLLVMCGGGGAANSGIKNSIVSSQSPFLSLAPSLLPLSPWSSNPMDTMT